MKNEYKNGRLSVINEMIRFHEKEMLAAQNAKGKNKDKDIHLSGVINANGKAIQNLKKKIRNMEDKQREVGVTPRSYGIVRWYDNTQKDVVCVDRATAEDYAAKYNKLAGEEKCYVDEDIWLPFY